MIMCSKTWIGLQHTARGCLWSLCLLMAACGGSSGSPGPGPSFSSKSSHSLSSSQSSSQSASSQSSLSSSGGSSSSAPAVTISGTLTYDWVPHNANHRGLNYGATEARPIRGARVDLVNSTNQILTQTQSDETGFYQLSAPANELVRVRVVAQLRRQTPPTWDISVGDNTQDKGLYSLVGNLQLATGSQRNLHAASGWGGTRYTQPRAAAPFAILDSVYTGLQRLTEAGNTQNLPPLQLLWSPSNRPATNPDDDYTTGEIGTSFYYRGEIYLLGQQDEDTDEYDHHVILHEWVHYLEDKLSRSNTIGGGHSHEARLDMRVAFSEGLANAMAAMMLDDGIYRDAMGRRQEDGFHFDLSRDDHPNKGWFSESTVESVLYNYYLSDANKPPRDLRYLVEPFLSDAYRNSDALTSIYLLSDIIEQSFPGTADTLGQLLAQQQVVGTGIYGSGETNDADLADALPVYREIAPGAVVNLCSNSEFGVYNKLANAQFLRLTVSQSGNYQISVTKNGGDAAATDPDFVVYRRGRVHFIADAPADDGESAVVNLSAGTYVLEVYDWGIRGSPDSSLKKRVCFDVSVQNQ